jgi:hypothetical protein
VNAGNAISGTGRWKQDQKRGWQAAKAHESDPEKGYRTPRNCPKKVRLEPGTPQHCREPVARLQSREKVSDSGRFFQSMS